MTDFQKLISNGRTSLEDIKAAGYEIESNGYNIYFRHISNKTASLPYWVSQFVYQEKERGIENYKKQLREILGISGPDDERP